MPKLRRLSGPDVIKILTQFGFAPLTQRGSHIKVGRLRAEGAKETLTIPNHRELDTGTTRAILRHATRFVSEAELRPHFYSD